MLRCAAAILHAQSAIHSVSKHVLHCAAANVHAQKAIHCVSKHVLRCQGHILLLRDAPYDQGRKWKKNTKGKQMVLSQMLPGLRVLNA